MYFAAVYFPSRILLCKQVHVSTPPEQLFHLLSGELVETESQLSKVPVSKPYLCRVFHHVHTAAALYALYKLPVSSLPSTEDMMWQIILSDIVSSSLYNRLPKNSVSFVTAWSTYFGTQ